MEKAINGNPIYQEDIEVRPIRWTEFTTTAVMGDATLATKDKGEKIIEETVKNIAAIIERNM
mgnify:CR=1 FL=1